MTNVSEGINRREAVLRLASTAVAAASVGLGGWYFHERRTASGRTVPVPDWRVPRAEVLPPIVAAHGPDPADNVRRAMVALGGMARFVGPGQTVVLKPNVGWDRLPEQAANTDPALVAELVRLCLGAGATRVVVTDNSCNDPRRCFARSGILEAATRAGATVVDAIQARFVPAALAGHSTGIPVIEEVLQADRVINVPVVKHHSLSRATLGLKNWMGVLGAGRNRLHQNVSRAIAELGTMFRPTLTVVDATRVLLAGGPQGGSLADVKAVNAIAVGIDPVACDAWGAIQMGLDPGSLDFIEEAEQAGLGRKDLAMLRDLGTA